jgi:NADH:ubiquinone reductase (H+-translocating)
VVASGQDAKDTKHTINTRRIYPPLNRDRDALLGAAAPELQPAPEHRPSHHPGPPIGYESR